AISMTVLVTAMFVTSPVEFSIFPSLLLVTTLMRLSLNVATTRVILLRGSEGTDAAGQVIQAFGQFVVGGSYVIGVVVFLILFLLNKMVIAAGTVRIAEVAARFTLDALPGKQMAIEADLNAGLITEDEANQRREDIRSEADFYGAMDGAGKFVQGDVNASILIMLVNIVGGILIGVVMNGMEWMEALSTYTILTVGDGLVAIIPGILISTSSGIIVSRSGAKAKMGEEFIGQLTRHYRAMRLVSAIMVVFAIVPGMPTVSFLILAAVLYIASRVVPQEDELISGEAVGARALPGGGSRALGPGGKALDAGAEPSLDTPEEVQTLLSLDTLELEVGYGLIPLVDEDQNGNLLSRIRSIRRQFALEMGVIIPSLHLRDNLQLRPGQYSVLIKGNEVAGAEILIDHYLAMDSGSVRNRVEGVETREPAFNLPALWIPEARKEEAMLAGYTVVDPATVIATHLTEVFKRQLPEFLGRQEVQALLDNLAKYAPKAVEDLVPGTMSLGAVQKVLQNLVRENVSIRDLLSIAETLADYAGTGKDTNTLTEHVRERICRTVVKPYLGSDGGLSIITLDAMVEKTLQEAIRQTESGSYLAIHPGTAQSIMREINQSVENAVAADGQPVVLTSPMVRPHLAQLMTRFLPGVPVISQAEIPADIRLTAVGNVMFNAA
ncbi:MAG: flagellar biosynthesis protein FlhA, partial [Desulfovibrionaceae bacterium]|nr:flagellar biosynthesis protein FlhA [Desulfovibrionaceae bacterium]